MGISLDFSNVSNPNERPPQDDYVFIVTDAQERPSKDSNKPNNLVISWEIANYDGPGRGTGNQWFHLDMNQEFLAYALKQFIAALQGVEVDELTEIDFEPEDLVGQTFSASLRHNADNDFVNLVGFGVA